MLTYPIVTFGLPLIVYVLLNHSSDMKNVFKYGFSWAFGYGGMWIGKWIIASMITGYNMMNDAISQAGVRTSHANDYTGQTITIFHTWYNNICVIIKWPYIIMIIIFICILVIRKKIAVISEIKKNIKQILTLILIMLMPFAWMALTPNHSYIHCFFVYRILSVSVYSGLSILGMVAQNQTEDTGKLN